MRIATIAANRNKNLLLDLQSTLWVIPTRYVKMMTWQCYIYSSVGFLCKALDLLHSNSLPAACSNERLPTTFVGLCHRLCGSIAVFNLLKTAMVVFVNSCGAVDTMVPRTGCYFHKCCNIYSYVLVFNICINFCY